MTVQTIPEYLAEEREKATDNQLRTEEEAARIQPLQHGHHRMAKQSGLQLVASVRATTKKRNTAAVTPKKPRAAGKTPATKGKKAVGKVAHRAGAGVGNKKPSHKRAAKQARG